MNKKNLVKKILILGMKNIMRRARIENSQRELEFKEKNGVVVIKNPGVFINENWIINIE